MTAPEAGWPFPAASVVRVIDGDSLQADLTVDCGFHRALVNRAQKLRLRGIDAYPLGTAKGDAAAAFVRNAVQGRSVAITTYKPYKYGDEFMCDLVVDGRDIAAELVAGGLALPWNGQGPRPAKEDPTDAKP